MNILSRPSSELYEPFIANVYIDSPDLKQEMYTSISSSKNEGIYLFTSKEGLPIAFISMHSSAYHPYCIYIRLAYCTEMGSHQLSMILAYIQEIASRPLFFLLDDRSALLQKALRAANFRLIRTTDIIHIRTDCIDSEKCDSMIRVRDLKNQCRTDLVALCKQVYIETHLANPPADMQRETWEELVFEGLLEEFSYVTIEDEKITGFSLLYESDDDSWELGWIGVKLPSDLSLLDRMVAKQIQNAYQEGISYIEKEVDTTDPYAMHLANSVKYEVKETLFSYLQEQEGEDSRDN